MKNVLYLGTTPPAPKQGENIVHYPVIQLKPRVIPPFIWDDFPLYTHVIFTSQHAVHFFGEALEERKALFLEKEQIAVGKKTATCLHELGCTKISTATEETQEGVIELLAPLNLEECYFLFPHSSKARKNLLFFLQKREVRHQAFPLYDTYTCQSSPLPSLDEIDEILFTSPSTVHAFLTLFGKLPHDKCLRCVGKITEEALHSYQKEGL